MLETPINSGWDQSPSGEHRIQNQKTKFKLQFYYCLFVFICWTLGKLLDFSELHLNSNLTSS